jgi:hypothetical protein
VFDVHALARDISVGAWDMIMRVAFGCRSVLALLAVAAAASHVCAESVPGLYRPFGVIPGQAVTMLERPVEVEAGLWTVAAPPNPHPLLSRYAVRTNARIEVCEVVAFAPAPQPNIDRVTATLRNQISEIAGEPQFVPFTRDPRVAGAWFWYPASGVGVAATAPSRIELLHVREGAGDAARLTVTFERICGESSGPNPFR